jgi:hypothetical protein
MMSILSIQGFLSSTILMHKVLMNFTSNLGTVKRNISINSSLHLTLMVIHCAMWMSKRVKEKKFRQKLQKISIMLSLRSLKL